MKRNKQKIVTPLRYKLALIGGSICVFLLLLELGMRIAGVIFTFRQEQQNRYNFSKNAACRIVCIGESTTALGGDQSYPSLLQDLLRQQCGKNRCSVFNKGVCGITTSGILADLEATIAMYKPNIVIAMIGINDNAEYVFEDDEEDTFSDKLLGDFKVYKLLTALISNMEVRRDKDPLPSVTRQESVAVQALRQLILQDPSNCQLYLALSMLCAEEKNLLAAEDAAQKAIALAPQDYRGYLGLGKIYYHQGRYRLAFEVLQTVLKLNPGNAESVIVVRGRTSGGGSHTLGGKAQEAEVGFSNDEAYVVLGNMYKDQEKFVEAKDMYEKALAVKPLQIGALIGLGWVMYHEKDYRKAQDHFEKAAQVYPQISLVWKELGWFYKCRKDYTHASAAFEKAISLNIRNYRVFLELAWIYKQEKKYAEAEHVLRQAIKMNPRDDRAIGEMAVLYREMDRLFDAENMRKKAELLRLKHMNALTVKNYRKIKAILDQAGIQLISMQYPLRNIEPLKDTFRGQTGVIFVDNEASFARAVEQEGYEAYFSDMFAGDFGHGTPKGNRLIAEQVMKTLSRRLGICSQK